MLSSEREYLLQAEQRDHPQYLRRSPDDPNRTLFQPGTATGRQQHVESRAVHEPHAREVESEPRAATAYHPQQLIPQLRGGLDIDLPADLDDHRGTGADGHVQVSRHGAVRDSRSRLRPGVDARHDPQ